MASPSALRRQIALHPNASPTCPQENFAEASSFPELKRCSSRRRHTLPTVQARLLAVHFYLEARAWPAEFVLDHEKKIEVFTGLAGYPPSVLPQRGGKPYLLEHFLFWQQDWRLAIAMVDQPQPGVLLRLKVFIREFLPLLRYLRGEPDLLIVTADKGRSYFDLILARAKNEEWRALRDSNSRPSGS